MIKPDWMKRNAIMVREDGDMAVLKSVIKKPDSDEIAHIWVHLYGKSKYQFVRVPDDPACYRLATEEEKKLISI